MRCDDCREALSAQLDGEDPATEEARVDAHVAGCPACRAWLRDAVRVSRAARLEELQVPDLAGPILEQARPTRAPMREVRGRAAARVALFAVAAAQWAAGLSLVFGAGLPGALPMHGAHELGAFSLALAVAFAWTAWRPARARAHLPLLSCLVGVLVTLTALDLAAGRISLWAEAGHLLLVAGLALTAVLARGHAAPGPPPAEGSAAGPGGSPHHGSPAAPPPSPGLSGPEATRAYGEKEAAG